MAFVMGAVSSAEDKSFNVYNSKFPDMYASLVFGLCLPYPCQPVGKCSFNIFYI